MPLVKSAVDHAAKLAAETRERVMARKLGTPPWNGALDMVTWQRAETVARKLFADEVSTGEDCLAEVGREGKPCGCCDWRHEVWLERVEATRGAMVEAFR